MRRAIVALGALALLVLPDVAGSVAFGQTTTDEPAIRAVLARQEADWNRGDLEAFASGYKHAPDILFIGRVIHRGYAEMLANYRQKYGTREKMGQLHFTNLEVQPLDESFATVTGRFHLERTAAGGGNTDGYFLLVVEQTEVGSPGATSSAWKIIRDDTTALPAGTISPSSAHPTTR